MTTSPAPRCAAASLARDEPAFGTASTVRGFVLVEYAGSWGRSALVDARLAEPVKAHLRATESRLGVKVLLVRRHERLRGEPAGCRVFVAHADPDRPWLEFAALDRHEELIDLDLDPLREGRSVGLDAHPDPLFLTCTHGRHDTCCAERGRPVAKALAGALPAHAWEVSHIGGDRFAASVLVLPDGLYYGRVDPTRAVNLAHDHLAGRLTLDLLRGRSGYPTAVQAAEGFLRERLDLTGVRALRLGGVSRGGPVWSVTLGVEDTLWTLRVLVGTAVPAALTCHAVRDNPAPSYALLDCRPASVAAG